VRRVALVVLGLLALGCGKYGPPTRVPEERPPPETRTSAPTPPSERVEPPGEFREEPEPDSDEETR
jgi:hypothetical protein